MTISHYIIVLWPWPSNAFCLDLVGWSARPNTAWKTKYKHKRLSSIFHQQSPDGTRLLPTPQIYQIPGENVGKSSWLLNVGWDIFFVAWPSVCWLQPFFFQNWVPGQHQCCTSRLRHGPEWDFWVYSWNYPWALLKFGQKPGPSCVNWLYIYIHTVCSGWWLTYPFWKIWLRQLR